MAEIPIERKTGGPAWLPWLLGLLILLLLGYCFTRNRGATSTAGDSTATSGVPAVAPESPTTTGGAAAAIDRFAAFVAGRDTTTDAGGPHPYTAEGIRRLATALEAATGGTPSIQTYADSMRSAVDRMQQSGPNDVHADDVKAAFSAAVSAMTTIDQARGRTRDVAPMRAIYGELSPTTPLMQQRPIVDRFFQAARDALEAMR